MSARFVIAQGNVADRPYETLSALARGLLELLDAAGHGERSFKLRDCNAARSCEPSGPCLSIGVLDQGGDFLEVGFAYVFISPPTADMHERLGAALNEASAGTLRHRKSQRIAA